MKKFVKKLILLFISIQFAACEGNLEPHLYGVVDTGNAFSTPADLSAATVALYYELRQKGWGPYLFCDGSSFVMDEVSTEEWTTKWSWVAFLNGTWTDADQMVKGFYNWTAPNITRCTYTIAKMEESPVTQSVKDLYIAEVRALRAFFMFDLYRLYGPMPMILEADQAINPDPDYKPYRPTAEEVGTFITTELRAAADALPIEQAEYGRITKGAALHYLLKYYMHEKLWQNALETANEIIGLNYYELEKDYASIFSAQNEGNKELMFVVRAEPLADYGNHTYANILPGDYASPHGNIVEGWSGHRMPWEFYDTFDENDRRRALAQAEYTSKSGATIDLRALRGPHRTKSRRLCTIPVARRTLPAPFIAQSPSGVLRCIIRSKSPASSATCLSFPFPTSCRSQPSSCSAIRSSPLPAPRPSLKRPSSTTTC